MHAGQLSIKLLWIRARDYKRFLNMVRCSTRNLCSEIITPYALAHHVEFEVCFESSISLYSLGPWSCHIFVCVVGRQYYNICKENVSVTMLTFHMITFSFP